MVDGLHSLGHNIVVGGNYNYTKVGYFSTTGTHGGKCLMTRSVQEGDASSVGKFHIICPYMLGNASSLAGYNVCITDIIEQRCLTMVNVSHHRYNRRTVFKIFFRIFLLMNCLDNFSRHVFCLKPEFFSNNIYCFGIETLVY